MPSFFYLFFHLWKWFNIAVGAIIAILGFPAKWEGAKRVKNTGHEVTKLYNIIYMNG